MEATNEAALKLMYCNMHPTVAGQAIADTILHMIRLDFIILMQMLCSKLEVPVVELPALILYLTDNSNLVLLLCIFVGDCVYTLVTFGWFNETGGWLRIGYLAQ